MAKRGYRTVTLDLPKRRKKKRHLKLYTSPKVHAAAERVLERLQEGDNALFYVTKLGQVVEAVLERGRVEGRAEIIAEQDAIKKRVAYRLPGRPKSN